MVRKPPVNQAVVTPPSEATTPSLTRGKKKDLSAASLAESLGFQTSKSEDDGPNGYHWPEAAPVEKPFNGDELKVIMADYLGALSIQLGQQTQLIGDLKKHTLQQEQKQQAALAQLDAKILAQNQVSAELKALMVHQEQQQQLALAQIQAKLDGQKQVLQDHQRPPETQSPALLAQLDKHYELTGELKAQLTQQEQEQQRALEELKAQVDRQMKLYQAQIRETEETLSSFVTINSHLVLSLKDQYQGTKEEMTRLRQQQEYLIDKKIHVPEPPAPTPAPPPPPEPPTPPKKRFLAFGKRPV